MLYAFLRRQSLIERRERLAGQDLPAGALWYDLFEPTVEERALAALAAAGIPAVLPARPHGSAHNVAVLVPRSRNDEAMALLHGLFVVGGDHPSLAGR